MTTRPRRWLQGKLKIRLRGERMQGGWTLVRMKGRKGERGRENRLLIKEGDETAGDAPDALTERYEVSVESGRRMEEIAAGAEEKAGR